MKTSGAAGRKLEKLDALTSLRFFAAAMIVIGHGVLDFGEAGFFYPFANLFTTSQGVSLFFVLSGFILAYAYPELPTFSHVKKFFIARFARIWPAHIFALILLFVAIQDVSYLNLSSDKLGQVILANVLLIHAWIPYKDFYESLNVVSWSISTEFFFYFLFPIFLYKWHHTWHIKLALVFLLWVGVLMFANDGLPIASTAGKLNVHGLIYINPLTRLLEFTVGIAFCGLYKILKPTSNTLSRSSATFLEIGVLLCVFFSMWASAVLANSSSFQLQFGSAAVYWLKTCGGFLSFALLILILAFQRGWISRILQNKWLVLLGEISFSLYLVHTFFLKYIRVYLKDFSFIDPSILYVIYWIVGITLAYLMYQVVEKPCRTYIVSFSREKTIGGHFYIPERDKNSFIFSLLVLSFIIVFLMIFKPTIIHFESKEKAVQLSQLPGNLLASPALFNNSLSPIPSPKS